MNFLGKILFPNAQTWERRRQMRIMQWVFFAAICFASIVGGLDLLAELQKINKISGLL
jgi:hypothetical protein